MCVVSMVYDDFDKKIPVITPEPWIPNVTPGIAWPAPSAPGTVDLSELRKLIADFAEAVRAAKIVDEKTGQPDCLDPEKAKLEERVRELEKLLAAPPEFVIVQGGTLEPGRYLVMDGKLYRAVDAPDGGV